MAAGIVAVIATIISFGIGMFVLGWQPVQVLWAIAAANLAACCCLPATLIGERVPWFKKYVIPNTLRTWSFFVVVFFSIFLGLVVEMREPRTFVWMVLPLIYTTGFLIWAYGPVHDTFVRRAQLRARERAKSRLASGADQ